MRPPSLADFIYARVCKLICERSLTLPFLDCVYALSNLSSAFLLLITLPNRTLPAQPPVRLYPCLQTAAVLGYTPALEMLYILGANFRLFLRFKGPASKGTRIYPHDRLQGPPFKKNALPHGSACFDPPRTERPMPLSAYTFRAALSNLIPPRPLSQVVHGRAKPLPRFPCCQ